MDVSILLFSFSLFALKRRRLSFSVFYCLDIFLLFLFLHTGLLLSR